MTQSYEFMNPVTFIVASPLLCNLYA